MVKKIIRLALFSLLIATASQGQKLKRYDDLLLFKDAQSQQPIIVINDSLVYKGKNLIPFKHTEYPDKISEYLPIEIGTKTYLVHKGCGPVLEFRNDSIVRVDRSFLHKNQYQSIPFEHNKEIYLFGGYGLFIFKNIITKYDFKSGEWNQIQTLGPVKPEPRIDAYAYRDSNNLYLFGGFTADEKDILKGKPVLPKLWKLNLPTMTWSNIGSYNADLLTASEKKVQVKNKLYLIDAYIIEIDFTSKIAKKYYFKNYELLKHHSIVGDSIYGIFSTTENKFYFKKTTIEELKGKYIGTVLFFMEPDTTPLNYPTMGLIGVTLLGLVVVAYKKRKHLFQPAFNGITYDSQRKLFLFKGKVVTHFEENEKKILCFLMDHIDQFVSLNQLNALFENPAQPETQSAIFKRREQAISGLLNKVAKLTSIPEKKLLQEQKNTEDKRLKDLLLLPKLLKKV